MYTGKSPKVLGYKEFFQDSKFVEDKNKQGHKLGNFESGSSRIIVDPKSFFNSNRLSKNVLTKKPLQKLEDIKQKIASEMNNLVIVSDTKEINQETPRFSDTNSVFKLNFSGTDGLQNNLVDKKEDNKEISRPLNDRPFEFLKSRGRSIGSKGNGRQKNRTRAKTIESEKNWSDLNNENFENFNEVLNMNITFSAQCKTVEEPEKEAIIPVNNDIKNTDLQKIDVINLDSRSHFNKKFKKTNTIIENTSSVLNDTIQSPFTNMKVARVKSGKKTKKQDFSVKRPDNYFLNTMGENRLQTENK